MCSPENIEPDFGCEIYKRLSAFLIAACLSKHRNWQQERVKHYYCTRFGPPGIYSNSCFLDLLQPEWKEQDPTVSKNLLVTVSCLSVHHLIWYLISENTFESSVTIKTIFVVSALILFIIWAFFTQYLTKLWYIFAMLLNLVIFIEWLIIYCLNSILFCLLLVLRNRFLIKFRI